MSKSLFCYVLPFTYSLHFMLFAAFQCLSSHHKWNRMHNKSKWFKHTEHNTIGWNVRELLRAIRLTKTMKKRTLLIIQRHGNRDLGINVCLCVTNWSWFYISSRPNRASCKKKVEKKEKKAIQVEMSVSDEAMLHIHRSFRW